MSVARHAACHRQFCRARSVASTHKLSRVTAYPDEELAASTAALREAQSLRQRLAVAGREADEWSAVAATAKARTAHEARDVRKLESLSLTMILTRLKGSHGDDVARQRAEHEAAEYEYRVCQERADAHQRVVDDLQRRLDNLGDVDAAYERALAAKEQWLQRNGGALAVTLLENAQRRGRLTAELKEIAEAQAAGIGALQSLHAAAEQLGSAVTWTRYDASRSGEALAMVGKIDLLEELAERMRAVDLALKTFGTELADIDMAGLRMVDLKCSATFFEVSFDNIFTDMALHERIVEAQGDVAAAIDGTNQIWVRLEERRLRHADEFARLVAQRDRLVLRA